MLYIELQLNAMIQYFSENEELNRMCIVVSRVGSDNFSMPLWGIVSTGLWMCRWNTGFDTKIAFHRIQCSVLWPVIQSTLCSFNYIPLTQICTCRMSSDKEVFSE